MGFMVALRKVQVNSKHIPQIISLAREIWLPTFAVYFSEDELNSLFSGMYSPEHLTITLQNPKYRFYIVENSVKKSIGYFATEVKKDFLKLDKIYVAPDKQGLGFGKWMYEQIANEAKEMGLCEIQLNVNRRNAPAIAFYHRLGFKILRSEDIPGPNGFIYDDYIMGVEV